MVYWYYDFSFRSRRFMRHQHEHGWIPGGTDFKKQGPHISSLSKVTWNQIYDIMPLCCWGVVDITSLCFWSMRITSPNVLELFISLSPVILSCSCVLHICSLEGQGQLEGAGLCSSRGWRAAHWIKTRHRRVCQIIMCMSSSATQHCRLLNIVDYSTSSTLSTIEIKRLIKNIQDS
jgi:hypothetical protein